MTTWQLAQALDAIIFDCDGTLSTLEGIDELAKQNGTQQQVEALTAKAMGETGINANLYQQRLELVRPQKAQVEALGEKYFAHITPDAESVIAIFQRLGKAVYIASAGLYPAVLAFGEKLKISTRNIFAVDIEFDASGKYTGFDHHSPLITNTGKCAIVKQLKPLYPQILLIGDGLNDFAARDLVARFVGYGGAYYHEKIAASSEYYIKTPSLLPLLALSLTAAEGAKLTPAERLFYQQSIEAIDSGKVVIR